MSFSTVPSFLNLLASHASSARFHRASDTEVVCPCQTPEGFRDPEFHLNLRSFGISGHQLSSGPINASTLAYKLVALGASGTPASPAIDPYNVVIASPSQVMLDLVWPKRGNVTDYRIYRSENGGNFIYNFNVHHNHGTYIDSTPLGAAGSGYVEPVLCNEEGEIPSAAVDVVVKAFVQPIQSTRATRLSTEYLQEIFGNIEADDHLGIFPFVWGGVTLNFSNWSQSGDDFIEYDGQRFFVVNANKIPDPGDGNPEHHWEVGLRLIEDTKLVG